MDPSIGRAMCIYIFVTVCTCISGVPISIQSMDTKLKLVPTCTLLGT